MPTRRSGRRPAPQEGGRDRQVERSPADVLRLVVAGAALLAVLLLEQLFGETLDGFAADLLAGLVGPAALDHRPRRRRHPCARGGDARRWPAVDAAGSELAHAGRRHGGRRRRCRPGGGARPGGRRAADAAPALSVTPRIDWLGDRGFPTVVGLAVAAAVLTAAAPWLSRRWRRLGWLLLGGLVVTRFLTSPASLDPLVATLAGLRRGSRRAGRTRRTESSTDQGGDHRRAGGGRRPRRAAAGGERRRPGVHALLRARHRRPPALRQGPRRGRAQRRPPLPPVPEHQASQLRRRAPLLVAAPWGRARGAPRPRGRQRRRPDPGPARLRRRRAERLCARLRGGRGTLAGPRRSPGADRRGPRRDLGLVGGAPAPSHRPPRPAPRQHLPRHRRAGVAHRPRLQRARRRRTCSSPPTRPNCWPRPASWSARTAPSPRQPRSSTATACWRPRPGCGPGRSAERRARPTRRGPASSASFAARSWRPPPTTSQPSATPPAALRLAPGPGQRALPDRASPDRRTR